MSFGEIADRAVDATQSPFEATGQAQLCKLYSALDPLENPPCSRRESGEWIAFDNRHAG
jgi:hypothetical protein